MCVMCCRIAFFFFKQKTAYEMRISDWSSDVCSSDLLHLAGEAGQAGIAGALHGGSTNRRQEHVIAKGALVAPVEGLQVDDGRIDRPFALRPDAIVREEIGRAHV